MWAAVCWTILDDLADEELYICQGLTRDWSVMMGPVDMYAQYGWVYGYVY